jgi:hypothetical protein
MGDFAVGHRGNDGRRVSKDQQRFYLTSRDRRRLRSLGVTIVTVAVLGAIVVFALKQLQTKADPSTPAEIAWAGQAQPLLATVDRIVTRHDALAAASAATGRPAARPAAALLASIRSTLRSYRKLPAAPPRLRAFRVEPIAALAAASKAYLDYTAGARSGDVARLARADLEWRQALALLGRLDQLVTGVTVPAGIKPSPAAANFIAFGASLASTGPHLRTAQGIETALRHAGSDHALARRSSAAFTALSLQAVSLPSLDNETSALSLQYQNALHHGVLASNDIAAGQRKQGLKAFATADRTYRLFLRDLATYGSTVAAAAATQH